MKIEIQRVTSWTDVLNAARFTQRLPLKSGEPSVKWKKKIIKAEHSPLRCLMFNVDFYDIPSYCANHLVRHVHAQPFVSTSRPDIDGRQPPREEQKKTDPVNMRLFLNAQEIINISKVRLCNKAELETRKIWNEVIEVLRNTEPELANACVPSCIYRGHCPEIKSCGFADREIFPLKVNDYINNLN
jgi:hypothetical protein